VCRGCNRSFKRNAWKCPASPPDDFRKVEKLSSERDAQTGLARARRTANPGSDDLGRSTRLSPSPRRRGNRRCDKPMVDTRTPCSPAPPGERSRRQRVVGALGRHHSSAPSGGEAGAACRAFCPRESHRNSSRPSIRRKGRGRRLHATRPRESRVQGRSPNA